MTKHPLLSSVRPQTPPTKSSLIAEERPKQWLPSSVPMALAVPKQPLCCMCKEPGRRHCQVCKSSRYCSKECQEADWPMHKLLCNTFKDFDKPPHTECVRAIFFGEGSPVPQFIWVSFETHLEGHYRSQILNLDDILKNKDAPHHALTKVSLGTNYRRDKNFDHELEVWHRDGYQTDGSFPTHSVTKLMLSRENLHWRGPLVVIKTKMIREQLGDLKNEYRKQKAKEQIQRARLLQQQQLSGDCSAYDVEELLFHEESEDEERWFSGPNNRRVENRVLDHVSMADFRDVVDFFVAWNESKSGNKDTASQYFQLMGKTKGVKIACPAGQAASAARHIVSCDIPKEHPIFSQHPISDISKMIGFPLRTKRVAETPMWSAWAVPVGSMPNDTICFWLDFSKDTDLKFFGKPKLEFGGIGGNMLLVRDDKEGLRPEQIETICKFYRDEIAPLMEHLEAAPEHTKAAFKATVLQKLTPEYFDIYLGKATLDDWVDDQNVPGLL